MIAKEDIKRIAESKITEIDGFFVDLKVNTSNVITLFFDRMDGVQVEHCLAVSRHIEEHFDRDAEDYELTVCSAGLDKPFTVEKQFLKHRGKEVGVLLKNGQRKRGVILSYKEGILTLETKKRKKGTKKTYIIEQVAIPEIEIKETKLKINFK
tara:strand:- start:10 stop:468 length:459 start_codon:yes stop_codon:yes gene_type:complete